MYFLWPLTVASLILCYRHPYSKGLIIARQLVRVGVNNMVDIEF